MPLHHETLRMERVFLASPHQVFAAYLDTRARESWSAPSETAEVRILNEDVRTGGSESTLCGAKGDMRYRTEVHYHLVETDRLISFSETLLEGDTVLTAALITFEFFDSGSGASRLVLTDQITSFVGPEGGEGHRAGFSQALDNLHAMLAG
jgi:uncharacterized protein YndB with AHSA1/START domain